MFQQFQNLQKSQNNPQEILNSMMNKYTPEQKQQFTKFINGFGVTEEQLKKIGINTK